MNLFNYPERNDLSNPKFTVKHRKGKYLTKLVERLRDVSCLKIKEEFVCNPSRSLRAHKIGWNHTTEKGGFSKLNEQLRDLDAFQFEVSQSSHAEFMDLSSKTYSLLYG
jgi:hypothetical protein